MKKFPLKKGIKKIPENAHLCTEEIPNAQLFSALEKGNRVTLTSVSGTEYQVLKMPDPNDLTTSKTVSTDSEPKNRYIKEKDFDSDCEVVCEGEMPLEQVRDALKSLACGKITIDVCKASGIAYVSVASPLSISKMTFVGGLRVRTPSVAEEDSINQAEVGASNLTHGV